MPTFQKALLPTGWTDNVSITMDGNRITAIEQFDSPPDSDGFAIPGMVNVHSHAFQYAFAGLSEYRTAAHDSFWTWRKLMYEFLETLTPESVYEIGKTLYGKMLKAGYTTVGEFHYLLHQPGGTPYDNVNEMADALIQAATEVGINICMLPVLYQRGGFDESELQGGQKRFGSDRELFAKMIDKLNSDYVNQPQVRIGMALHSLRAVSVESAKKTLGDIDSILPGCPIHVHVAEQTQEVDDCLAATGKRPVELLMDSFDVNERWCLIHATHMTDQECQRVADSGAVIGVCPTTEANLGDGVFMADDYLRAGGRLAIGSDSHISVNAAEELRLLEYAQRLTKRQRAVLCREDESCGTLLYRWAGEGGCQVTGFGPPTLSVGSSNGLAVVSQSNVENPRILDCYVFHG